MLLATTALPVTVPEAERLPVAVIDPELNSPLAPLATIAFAVLLEVAVVAEFDTLPAVEIVLNLLSVIEPDN